MKTTNKKWMRRRRKARTTATARGQRAIELTQPEAFPDDGCHNVCSPRTDGKQSIVLSPHEILNRHAASGTEGRDGGLGVDEVEDLG